MIKINHTQLSNEFIDKWMMKLSGSATKCFIVISRKTIGWHKDIDQISDSQLIKMTGQSLNTVKSGIKELLENKIIIMSRTGQGKGTITTYEINYDNISNNNISNSDILNESNVSNIDILPSFNISNSDTTKENLLKKEYKENSINNQSIIKSQIDEIYNLYPSKDINNNNRSTSKSKKDKDKIHQRIKELSYEEVKKTIKIYLDCAAKNKTWIKNLSVLLNKFPDLNELENNNKPENEPDPEFDKYTKEFEAITITYDNRTGEVVNAK